MAVLLPVFKEEMIKMCSKLPRIISSLLIMIIIWVMFAGCRRTGIAGQSLSYNICTQPETIDPALSISVEEANIILANFQGLMRLDKDNKAVPGIAESYKKDSDVKYTFKLREAKWSDGKSVTAGDFEYAWKRVLNPETGAKYAYQLYYIKNGEAYNKKITSADNVGIRVIDNKTLEVTLESPTEYFLELLALPIYMPVREDVILENPGKWAESPTTYIGNGPFRMTSWRAGDAIEFVRNEKYYDVSRVKLNKVIFRMIKKSDEYLAAWERGEIDIIESPPSSEISRLKNENKLTIIPYVGTYFYVFNNNVKPLNDSRVRKALTYAIDRNVIIQNVLKNEALPAAALVPKGIPDADITRDFRDVGGAYFRGEGQVAEAQRLLYEAGYPGGSGFPVITLNYDNTGYHRELAQTIQEMWMTNLGITANLQAQDWEVLKRTRTSGSFEIARQGWIADFMDPMAFLDMFVTDRGNNEARYSNKTYDELIASAKRETDQQKRIQYLHDAENVIMGDMPVLPVFFYTNLLLIKPHVKGIVKSPLGFMYFDQAYIEGKQQ